MEKVTLRDIYDAVNSLREEMNSKFVTKEEFGPVRSLVYGVTALMLTSVIIALITLVIRQ